MIYLDTSIDPPIDAAMGTKTIHEDSGTPGLAFQAGWSHPKKLWCCQREQRGCEGSPGQQRVPDVFSLGLPPKKMMYPQIYSNGLEV